MTNKVVSKIASYKSPFICFGNEVCFVSHHLMCLFIIATLYPNHDI